LTQISLNLKFPALQQRAVPGFWLASPQKAANGGQGAHDVQKPMRIWYQSYVDYENGASYWDKLRAYLADIVDPGTIVDVHGITPHDSYAHALVEFRCAREVICNAARAEREGYDAFILGHFQDAGLYEARACVDIPVLALGEASMLYSCQLGQRIGIVTINTRYIPWFHHQIRKYGLEGRVTGVHAMTFEPGQILAAYDDDTLADKVVELFADQARPLVAGGVVVTGGVTVALKTGSTAEAVLPARSVATALKV